jgi:hypothetical protein
MIIKNYRPLPNEGKSAISVFDVYIPKMKAILRNVRYCLSKKGHYFLGLPSFSDSKNFDGKPVYQKTLEFDDELQKEFEKQILDAVKEYIERN